MRTAWSDAVKAYKWGIADYFSDVVIQGHEKLLKE